MLRHILLYILFFPVLAFGQDTLYYDTLITSNSGDYLTVKFKSEFTGLEDQLCLQQGTWHFYSNDGEILKEATYVASARDRSSLLDGEVKYYDLDGELVMTQLYSNGDLVQSTGYREILLIEGIQQYAIRKEYGKFLVFEYQDRFNSSKIQTVYSNLRDADELAYYRKEEKRLASPHLLDTAKDWPNDPRNLIANPMMEIHPLLKTSQANIKNEVESWSPASPTPDFFYSEDCKSGTGCLGFRVYSLVKDIEYLQNKLVRPLKKDSVYCFSMYVKLSNQSSYTSNGLGVHFSKKPVKDIEEVIETNASLMINENYLPYKTKWMLLQCSYKAKGGEKYVTIGSFKKLNKIMLTRVKGHSPEAYYIIDDVSLFPKTDSLECACNLYDMPAESMVITSKDTLIETTNQQDSIQVGYRFVLENVFFDNDQFDLLPESIQSLNRLLNIMQTYPELKIEIAGHTSSLGGREHNIELSYNRAKSVKKFLVVQGIDKSRIKLEGYGPDKPIASNEDPIGQAKNRRVEIKILKM